MKPYLNAQQLRALLTSTIFVPGYELGCVISLIYHHNSRKINLLSDIH